MSEDEKRSEEEVEAHHAGPKGMTANEEPQDEVEAHHAGPKGMTANVEPGDEADDVEAHMRRGV